MKLPEKFNELSEIIDQIGKSDVTPIQAYWKLDHTICMNEKNLKFNLDNKDDPDLYDNGEGYDPIDTDCKSMNEAINCLETIEAALKALEIIKEKEVNIQYFKICLEVHWDYDLFEEHCRENNEWEDDTPYKYSMKKEEFDLLKEVLCNGR